MYYLYNVNRLAVDYRTYTLGASGGFKATLQRQLTTTSTKVQALHKSLSGVGSFICTWVKGVEKSIENSEHKSTCQEVNEPSFSSNIFKRKLQKPKRLSKIFLLRLCIRALVSSSYINYQMETRMINIIVAMLLSEHDRKLFLESSSKLRDNATTKMAITKLGFTNK